MYNKHIPTVIHFILPFIVSRGGIGHYRSSLFHETEQREAQREQYANERQTNNERSYINNNRQREEEGERKKKCEKRRET